MRICKTVLVVMMFVALAGCSRSQVPEESESVWVSFTPPEDTGFSMYRNGIFSPDWQLELLNPIDWDTALYNSSVGVVLDEQGRVVEAAGFWGGRRSDNVLVAGMAPLLRFSYQDGSEIVTMHYSDGTSFPAGEVYGYRVSRDPDTQTAVKVFLGADGEIVEAGGVGEMRFQPDGTGWFVVNQYSPNGDLLSGTQYLNERFRLDDDGNALAIQVVDGEGLPQEIRYGAYTFEMVYDQYGNIIERKKLDENGEVLNSLSYPGWQTYEKTDDGLLLESLVLSPSGEPAEDYSGIHRSEFSYDEYGRMTSVRGYDIQDEPVEPGGVWETRTEYDNEYLVQTVITFDAGGNIAEVSGIAKTVIACDQTGNVIEMTYWDSKDEPARDPAGVHRYLYEYDEHCRLLENSVWEPDGEPGVSTIGHHSERILYENGFCVGSEMLDLEGNPIR